LHAAAPVLYTLPLHDALPICRLVSDELAAVAAEHGDARRTVLLESASAPAAKAGASLEVADEPCGVHLTGTGLIARVSGEGPLRSEEHTSELQSRENLVCRLL